ncbi:hypothetical protein MKX03_029808 [Papaver bracteatum]|nr:hypothetical protein MKX03_029808 [Papaver bracteatum]
MSKLPEEVFPQKALGLAAKDNSGVLTPFKFSRRETGDEDVTFKVMFCGICHSDLHSIKNEWGYSFFPLVPGHEIVGIVSEVGHKVSKFKVGDRVGVGCLVGACQSCDSCSKDVENYCNKRILTYNSVYHDGSVNYGGYSDIMVANERYVVKIPDNMPLDASAPLLCVGITVYSPMKYFGLCEPGTHLGVVGLGGLGHVAVKFAKAFGMKVTVISTSPDKEKEAIEHLGADAFVNSRNQEQLMAVMGTLDGILDTVSVPHSLLPMLGLLKADGKLIMLGLPDKPLEVPVFPLLFGRKTVAGSIMGGMKETQEMLDFAAKHNITADIEVVAMDYVNTAMERLAKGDVRYRFVIDIANTVSKIA